MSVNILPRRLQVIDSYLDVDQVSDGADATNDGLTQHRYDDDTSLATTTLWWFFCLN